MNMDIIKDGIFSLHKKYISDKNDEEISKLVDLKIRKLSAFSKTHKPVSVVTIETDIETKMKKVHSSESSILDMKSYIRKIQNLNVCNPISLLCFLNSMSNIGSESIDLSSMNRHLQTSQKTHQLDNRTSTPLMKSNFNTNRLPGSDISSIHSARSGLPRDNNIDRFGSHQATLIESQKNNANVNVTRSSHNYQISNELTEFSVIGEMLFIILGNEGMWLAWNQILQQLSIRNGAVLPYSMYGHVLALCQCGTAYRRIRAYIEHGVNNPAIGVVYQGFCVALNDHLASFVNLVASLQAQYNSWAAAIDGDKQQQRSYTPQNSQIHLTLEILLLKLHEPMEVLGFIVSILDKAGDLRGGQLASVIYWHILHGTSDKVQLTRNLLLHAVEPFYDFIQKWIYDGILEESHEEFFVAINYNYDLNISWTDKYALRTHMIPQFITSSQSEKILLTGKSINFLREVCGEKLTFKNRKEIAATLSITAKSMINQVVDRSFDNMINSVYVLTGENLLKVMFERYHLMDHLKALRKYMLHGQGDFILRMIEIIGPELSKPANELKENHMGGSLEMVIKSTNAQYDSRDILDRVRISFMRIAENDSGWDIFTLNYQIADIRPLYAVVNPSSFSCYLRAFNILFRSRRVHFILNSFFKERNSSHRAFNKILEVSGLLHFSHVLVMDMLHFVNQVQYYINFEVLECSWKKFMDSISKATDLDSVMKHHEYFLKQVTSRCLLEPESRELLSNLRTIYELIISFESLLNDMLSKFHDELRCRMAYREKISALADQNTWGVDDRREKKENERIMTFTKTNVLELQNKLKAFNYQYESHLVKFLFTIVDHSDSSLRCLYANLDFNGRYKDRIRDYRRKPQLNIS